MIRYRRFIVSLTLGSIITMSTIDIINAQQPEVTSSDADRHAAQSIQSVAIDGITLLRHEHKLWLQLTDQAAEQKRVVIPRFCATIRSMAWLGHPDHKLSFLPEPQEWVFTWDDAPGQQPTIEVIFDSEPRLPEERSAARSTADGSLMLAAHDAETFGEKLRFEPQPFKNTVGYWTVPTDHASWDLDVEQSGQFTVALLQGCGGGQGGSDARLTLRNDQGVTAEVAFQTVDTGHFQNFRWVHLGTVTIATPGRYELRIEPVKIAKAALFDVRMIHLVRQAKITP